MSHEPIPSESKYLLRYSDVFDTLVCQEDPVVPSAMVKKNAARIISRVN